MKRKLINISSMGGKKIKKVFSIMILSLLIVFSNVFAVTAKDNFLKATVDLVFKNAGIETIIRKENDIFIQQPLKTITGTVTDASGQPLPGVTILIKGTTQGTISDNDGEYSISALSESSVLIFSFVGLRTQEIKVEAQTIINVTMVEDIIGLDEVVAIGYGTVKKSDLTGSVEKINADIFRDQSMTQLTEMLTGTVAGLNTNQGARAAGGSSLEIRGPTSLKASTSPLIVLDGVIFHGSIQDINPNDIASIDILKDASSAAVFGSRAASGVIILTTTKGRVGTPTINFSTSIGMAEVTNPNIRPMRAEEYTNFRRDLLRSENPNMPEYYYHNPINLPGSISQNDWLNMSTNPNPDITREWLNRLLFYSDEVENFEAGKITDWYDLVMQKGLRQNYDFSVSGGTEQISYYASLGYTDNEGVQAGDQFSTLRTRLNLDTKIADFFNVGIHAQYTTRDNSSVLSELGQFLNQSPYGNMYEPDGSVKWYPNGYIGGLRNPLINHLLQDRLAKVNSLFTTIFGEVALPYNFTYRLSYQPRLVFSNTFNFWGSNTITGAQTYSGGYGTRQQSKTYEWMVDQLLKWNKQYGMHNFDFTFLYNIEKYQSWSSDQSGETFETSQLLSYHALQFATKYMLSNTDNYHTGDALMARLNYTLNSKYLLTLSFRRDGYSAFGQKNPRADFSSVAFAWIISKENFYNFDLLNLLKIRTSWGVNGNRDIGRYSALAQLGQNVYSDGTNVLMGVYNTSLANPDLRWERTEAFNVGLDFAFMEGQINGSIDVYDMTTNDLLMDRSLPRITGFTSITTNLGELQNRGLEVSLKSSNINTSKFIWKSDLVFSLNRNKIVSLFGDMGEYTLLGKEQYGELPDFSNQWFIGEAIDRIWDYDIIGVWQVDEKEEAARYGLKQGDYKGIDVNDDGVYSETQDKQFIGWQRPRYRIGLRNSFVIGNLSASIFIRSDLGHKGSVSIFKHTGSNTYDRRGIRNVPYWTPENPSNKYGSLTANQGVYGGDYNIYFDRSFVRIQDITLSYDFPNRIYQRIKLKNLRVVGSVRNLFTFDTYENWDPESGGTPMPRIYTVGVDITL